MTEAPYRTDFGVGLIVRDDDGSVTRIVLPGAGTGRRQPPVIDALVEPIEEYFAGQASMLPSEELIAAAASTPLRKAIYQVVSKIRPGHTMTYSQVAAAVGRPGAARAVGAAMARNPFPPVIPCHRVIASDGSLAGYAGGLDMKAALLAMESNG